MDVNTSAMDVNIPAIDVNIPALDVNAAPESGIHGLGHYNKILYLVSVHENHKTKPITTNPFRGPKALDPNFCRQPTL